MTFSYKELIPSLSPVIISDFFVLYFSSSALHFLNIAKVTILLPSNAGTVTFKRIFLCSIFPTRTIWKRGKLF